MRRFHQQGAKESGYNGKTSERRKGAQILVSQAQSLQELRAAQRVHPEVRSLSHLLSGLALKGELLTKVTPRQEFLIQRPKGDGGNAFEFSAIMVQSGQGSHSLDGRHKELRQSHWVLFGSDFAPGLSIQ